ncbi:MAG: ArnT family glycosyltransferase [Candidatus Rokuibacteriota bacterium]
MRAVPFVIALVVVGVIYFAGLGRAPFFDPSEGFHAQIARTMAEGGDWVTPHVNGVRYFDKPPLLYWLMAATFRIVPPVEAAARFWPAVAALGVVGVTMRLGTVLASPRVGLLAGLFTAANLGVFLYARIVKTDLLFILCIMLAWLGFARAYLGGGRAALALFWTGLGLAALSKDVLGAVGPLVAVALFLWLVGERNPRRWAPWWGLALLLLVTVPWYAAVEWQNPGFLWYTLIDNHVLNFARRRVFPDEDVPLSALVFGVVTLAAFLPWTLALPPALARAVLGPRRDARERLWLLVAIWPILLIGFFTLSPFKLPHYGLPAFPALALLVARAWDATLDGAPEAPRPLTLMLPLLVFFVALAGAFALTAAGRLPVPLGALTSVDVATRNLAAHGGAAAQAPLEAYVPIVAWCAVVFGLAALALTIAAWRRRPAVGVGAAVAAMLAFLPIAGAGMAEFGRARAAGPVAKALVREAQAGDTVVFEGPLENNGSVLLALGRRVSVVDGLQSNLAFGATFPEARDVFWDGARLRAEWMRPGRRFLVSALEPDRSVVGTLPPGTVRLVARGGGRYLYGSVPAR